MSKKLFKKEILRVGKWVHPNAPDGVLSVTKDTLSQIIQNFKKTPFVPVLRGHISNLEAEQNPSLILDKNIKGLEIEGDKLYAKMSLDEKELDRYNDVSVSINPEYVDKETGKNIGATLTHIAAVLSPYIKGMADFMALSDDNAIIINLSEEVSMAKKKTMPKLEEVKLEEATQVAESSEPKPEEVKVEEPSQEVKEANDDAEKTEETTEEVSEAPVAEVTEEPKEATEEVSEEKPEATEEAKTEEVKPEEPKEAEVVEEATVIASEAQRIKELEEELRVKNIELSENRAVKSYDVLFSEGKITPAMKESFILLHKSLSSEKKIELSEGVSTSASDLLNDLFSKAPRIFNLEEQGVDTEEGQKKSVEEKVKDAIRKLPVHERKTDIEFEEFWGKYKRDYMEGSETTEAK